MMWDDCDPAGNIVCPGSASCAGQIQTFVFSLARSLFCRACFLTSWIFQARQTRQACVLNGPVATQMPPSTSRSSCATQQHSRPFTSVSKQPGAHLLSHTQNQSHTFACIFTSSQLQHVKNRLQGSGTCSQAHFAHCLNHLYVQLGCAVLRPTQQSLVQSHWNGHDPFHVQVAKKLKQMGWLPDLVSCPQSACLQWCWTQCLM